MTWMKSALPCTNLFVHTEAQEQFASSSTMGSKRKAAEMNVGANNVAQLQEDVNSKADEIADLKRKLADSKRANKTAVERAQRA